MLNSSQRNKKKRRKRTRRYDAVGKALAQQDAVLNKVAPKMARLNTALIEGHGSAAAFEAVVMSIGNAVHAGMSFERANYLLDLLYEKYDLTDKSE
jgi:hypothetical protein